MTNEAQGKSREEAIKDFEADNHSVVAKFGSKEKSVIIWIAGVAVLLGVVWLLKHSSENNPVIHEKTAEQVIAEKKPVAKLKEAPVVKEEPVRPSEPAYDNSKAQREQEERVQREKDRQKHELSMKSSILAIDMNGRNAETPPASTDSAAVSASKGGGGAQDANSRFERSVSGNAMPVSKSEKIDLLPYKILQGKMIEAVLEPRAISDLPGMVCATVQRDVYGTQGHRVLIPWGSKVCGVYSAEIKKGQDRLFIVWNNVIRPDGVTVAIDSPGADQLGSAGMGGQVDNHFLEIFGASAAISIIGAGAANAGVNSGDQYNSSSAYRQSVAQSAAESSQSVLQQYGSIQPTITVPAGSIVRIYSNRILDFTGVYKEELEAEKNNGTLYIQ